MRVGTWIDADAIADPHPNPSPGGRGAKACCARLIFDVHGTAADIERDGNRVAFNRALADAGIDWRWHVPRYDVNPRLRRRLQTGCKETTVTWGKLQLRTGDRPRQ